MAVMDIDFEGTGDNGSNGQAGNGTQGGAAGNGGTKEDVTALGGGGTTDLTTGGASNGAEGGKGDNGNGSGEGKDGAGDGNQGGTGEGKEGEGGNGNNSSTGELTPGTKLEVDGKEYTIADNGDVVDKDGKVVKPAAEVKDWLDSFEQEEENTLDINSIQESLGVEITDDKGKAIEFTNDAAGVKAYVSAVLDLQRNEIAEGAINKLYADNPMLKQFQDYVQVTGSPVGFGELPDRSGITIDKDNLTQQEAIVRMAAKEFGNKSLNDNYINYLKDTGALYDEAINQLKALQEKDKNVRIDIQNRAEAARAQELKEVNEYWNKINNVINSGTIAGYKLPASFVKEVNGQKQTLTKSDFFNYLSKHTEVDANGNKITAYQRDLQNESEEDFMNRDLLAAWLMYTGGTYKDLVDMAVKEEQVRVLKLKSKQGSTRKAVKFIKPQTGKTDFNDILLG